MTYKERLQIEHPEKVRGVFNGGCCDCPHTYGYEKRDNCVKNCRWNYGKGCVYCWNREIPEFNIGDKVRVRSGIIPGEKYEGITLYKQMIFHEPRSISEIHGSNNQFYSIGKYSYTKEMLEKVEERNEDMQKFTIEDLKENMLLETREGEKFLWINGKPRSISNYIGFTTTNLKNKRYETLDIVKVGYPSKEASTIKEMLTMDFEEVVWKEEPNVKDVSLEEINALLKEKYPNVDEFNLPIKE